MDFDGVVRSPAYLQVAEQIRAAIVTGDLEVGQSLPTERVLATKFGVGRTTIREALRWLEAQGLLARGRSTTAPTIVGSLPDVLSTLYDTMVKSGHLSVLDLIELRGVVELYALERINAEPDFSQHHPAAVPLARMEAGADDLEAFLDAYLDFHLAIADSPGNVALHDTMRATQLALRDHLRGGLEQLLGGPDASATVERILREHRDLLDAVVVGNAYDARELLKAHLNSFYEQLLVSHGVDGADREPDSSRSTTGALRGEEGTPPTR